MTPICRSGIKRQAQHRERVKVWGQRVRGNNGRARTGRESFSPCLDRALVQKEKHCLWRPADLVQTPASQSTSFLSLKELSQPDPQAGCIPSRVPEMTSVWCRARAKLVPAWHCGNHSLTGERMPCLLLPSCVTLWAFGVETSTDLSMNITQSIKRMWVWSSRCPG